MKCGRQKKNIEEKDERKKSSVGERGMEESNNNSM